MSGEEKPVAGLAAWAVWAAWGSAMLGGILAVVQIWQIFFGGPSENLVSDSPAVNSSEVEKIENNHASDNIGVLGQNLDSPAVRAEVHESFDSKKEEKFAEVKSSEDSSFRSEKEAIANRAKMEGQSANPPVDPMSSEQLNALTQLEFSFLSDRWRLIDESCSSARRFGIVDGVVEVYGVGPKLIYSQRITKVIYSNEILMQDNSRFIFKGEELHHVTDQSVNVFMRC